MSATAVAVPHTARRSRVTTQRLAPLCALLTLCVPLVHGYHPYAEDGGIYLAGIKYCLHPGMYAYNSGFVTAHVQSSVFAHAVAFLARAWPPALMGILFALYLLTTFLTLYTAGRIAEELTADTSAQRWTVVLLAACLTLPVAGTSLMLMDPYVTARSLALPCVLSAIAAALRLCVRQPHPHDGTAVFLYLLAAVVLHPLSGGYGVAAVAAMIALASPARRVWLAALLLCAMAACIALQFEWRSVPAGYAAIAESRTYWALSNWAWYEIFGLVAPLLLLAAMCRSRALTAGGRLFASAVTCAGLLSITISLLFVHAHGPNFAVARVQPLRIFQYVYLALPLCAGCWLAMRVRSTVARAALCVAVATCMIVSQRSIYADSNHVEWPWAAPANAWEQAFLWVRDHTPADAVIAVDAQYITAADEDAHNIRALTERSVLADVSKDAGIASIRPSLTRAWYDGVALQRNLASVSDSERVQRLRARGIAWLVLPGASQTAFPCPYRNRAVAVCRVPDFVRATK